MNAQPQDRRPLAPTYTAGLGLSLHNKFETLLLQEATQQHSLGVVRDPVPRNPNHRTFIPGPPILQVTDNLVHVSNLDIDMEMCDVTQVELTGGILSRNLEDIRDPGSAESTLPFPNQCTQPIEQDLHLHDQGQSNQPYLLSDSNDVNEAEIAWNHKGKVIILEPAARILELLKLQPKSSATLP
jgi:hypothetical protein